jgi:hypothetical protein
MKMTTMVVRAPKKTMSLRAMGMTANVYKDNEKGITKDETGCDPEKESNKPNSK